MNSEPEVAWGYQDLLLFTFLSLVSMLVCQALMHFAIPVFRMNPKSGTVQVVANLVAYACIFAVLFALIKLQYGRRFWSSLAWVPSHVAPGAAFLFGFVFAIAISIAGALLHIPDIDTPIKKLLSNRTGLLEFGVLAVTLGPLCEELVFRGFVQPVLVRSMGRVVGIVITASLFGALHLAQNGFLWQFGVLITLAGVAFGWMREYTGSTQASTWMHAGFNSTVFLQLLQHKLPHAQ